MIEGLPVGGVFEFGIRRRIEEGRRDGGKIERVAGLSGEFVEETAKGLGAAQGETGREKRVLGGLEFDPGADAKERFVDGGGEFRVGGGELFEEGMSTPDEFAFGLKTLLAGIGIELFEKGGKRLLGQGVGGEVVGTSQKNEYPDWGEEF